ncbi:SurA N-terminal domain-containing protein [Rhodoligotrophos appendicifer]|uniref:SurA N-terminal domain-containing protein n=1 Tax=Rhodoligotrophos appendicifer TaxID=987056 RepID=UPI0014794174|nr:SurA N-terminal domain-containing protein [Rhodoligotrophos appendicifer]
MRSKAAGWVAKLFIALIAMSFAVWGVSDIFTGPRNVAVATVGDREIGVEQYQQSLQQQMRSLSQRLGRSITLEEARQFGFDLQVLNEMVRNTALEVQAQNLGLAVPDIAIAERAARIPAFRNPRGEFDRSTFLQVLRANGLTEAQYLELERTQMLRESIASAVDRQFQVPETLIKAAFENQASERVGTYITLPAPTLENIPAPTEAEITEYYNEHKRSFTAPEFRTLTVVAMEPEDVAKGIEIPEAEVEAAYQQRLDQFSVPEKRQVLQMAFADEAAARAARAKLQSGADFVALAKEQGLTEADYTMGLVTKRQIPDTALADAAFSLQKDQVSQPVEGRLSVMLLKVTDIQPGQVTPLAEVRDKLLQSLKVAKATDRIGTLHDEFEDERASGASLREAAEKMNLPVLQIDGVDRSGKGPDGAPITNLPALDRVVAAAFESDVGVENDPVSTEDEGFVWFDVADISPEAAKSVDEVRPEIIKLISTERAGEALRAKAEGYATEVRSGAKSFDQLAQELSLAPQTTPPLKRNGEAPGLTKAGVAALFATPEGGVGVANDPETKTTQLIQTTKIAVPAFDPDGPQAAALQRTLEQSLSGDIFGEYVADLEKDLGVTMNNEVWSRISSPQS